MLVESGYLFQIYDLQIKYGSFLLPVLFFISMHFAIVLLIGSISKGLAWEIYKTVDTEIEALEANSRISAHSDIVALSFSQLESLLKKKGALSVKDFIAYNNFLG